MPQNENERIIERAFNRGPFRVNGAKLVRATGRCVNLLAGPSSSRTLGGVQAST